MDVRPAPISTNCATKMILAEIYPMPNPALSLKVKVRSRYGSFFAESPI